MTKTYLDEKGYLRYKGSNSLVHRNIAYHQIYLKNKDKYPLSFGQYQIHHKNKDKRNNRPENLEIVTGEQHEKIHWLDPQGQLIIWLGTITIVFWFLWFVSIPLIILVGYLLYKRYKG